MTGRIIETLEDMAEGAEHLARIEPRFARALAMTGPLPLRRKPDGFATLLSAIVSQQVSTAAARAIWGRVEALGPVERSRISALSDADLKGCGLSRQKIAYARAIAESGLDFDALRRLPDLEVVAELVRIKGIGIWTAEIYAMFSLGRSDIFAPGDLALREAVQKLFELPARPGEKALREMSLTWSPWRSVAAVLLWEYYHVIHRREGVT
jgi:DNA-3-methyladenine glycosylase II